MRVENAVITNNSTVLPVLWALNFIFLIEILLGNYIFTSNYKK